MDASLQNLPEQGSYKETKLFERLCLGYTLPDMNELLRDLHKIQTIYAYYKVKYKKIQYNNQLYHIIGSKIYFYSRNLNDNEANIESYGHIYGNINNVLTKEEVKNFLLKKKMLGYLKDYTVSNYFNLYNLNEVYMYLQNNGYSFEQVMTNINNSLQRLQNEIVSLIQNGNWCDRASIDISKVNYFMTRTNKQVYLYIIPDAVKKDKSKMIYYLSAKVNDKTELLNMYLNYLLYRNTNSIKMTKVIKQVNRKDIKGKMGIVL